MFEYGFIKFIKLTSHKQASQLSQIIQIAIRGFESSFVSIRCWSTLPKWERDNWMNVQPSKHLILIKWLKTKGNGLKGILNCPSKILLLLLNVGEIILIIRFLKLLRIYGKIIIS